jgi:hypothetical protein
MLEAPDLEPSSLSEHARANRDNWNSDADKYQSDHGADLVGPGAPAWGSGGSRKLSYNSWVRYATGTSLN